MSLSPYLLHVTSHPTKVSGSLWSVWYTTEHLPDLVNSKIAKKATFYTEIPTPFETNPKHPRNFLALYQTEFEEPLKTDNFATLRRTSPLFEREGGTENIQDNGDFDTRSYKLIQEYDPKDIGNVPPPHLLAVEMYPKDVEDFEKWYREEHLKLLSKVPGYRRSIRYRLGPKTPQTKGDDPPTYLALHEMDDLSGFGSTQAAAANETKWTKKHLTESSVFVARGWKLVHSEGF